MFPAWTQPSCSQITTLGFVYGGLTRLTGLDTVFMGMGAPPIAHWALAGGFAKVQCDGWSINAAQDMAMAIAGGLGGGYIAAMLMSP